ncbi:hypothetical protein PR202_ga14627 [Eleusine coracana subsp. coracana]|uniref:C3H1-type domain-containing protein n=1 Tax=Eleusine coracana subsp. coracana TaxID=191504 RepID=A0AAV5CH61_ELECO|nr:hypothetical protein PR202_ga14627 [Eleusine coracana subsp. coracana]
MCRSRGSIHQFDHLSGPLMPVVCADVRATLASAAAGSEYKMGFCPNGPTCRYKHIKLPGPPPPVEEVLRRFYRCAHSTNLVNIETTIISSRRDLLILHRVQGSPTKIQQTMLRLRFNQLVYNKHRR